MKTAKMAIISIVLLLGMNSTPAQARIDDGEYDLMENSRQTKELSINDRELNLDCVAKCTSMDPTNARQCAKKTVADSCLKAGCVWSCQ